MSPELVSMSVPNTESEHVSCIVYTQCNRDQDLVRFLCKIVRYCTSNFAKKCGMCAGIMIKSAVMERQKYSVLTTCIVLYFCCVI